VIAHVVLFRPRPDLTPSERDGLAGMLATALRSIPSIRRARVGRRVTHGRPYEQLMHVDYAFSALLEFDDVAGLEAYLEHPAHDALGTHFFQVLDTALMYDYELFEGEEGIARLRRGE
jgi:hypothetical protein